MTLDEFINKYNGKKIDFDGQYGNQCVDLYRQYVKEVLNLHQSPSVGGAYQIFDTAQSEYYTKVENTPTGVPPRGAIVIWKKEYGGYGHVGIVEQADVNGMLVFSQNHTGNLDPCESTSYSYNLVKGWLIPKGDDMWYQIGNAIFHDDVYVSDPNIVPWNEVKKLNPQGYQLDPVGTPQTVEVPVEVIKYQDSPDTLARLENAAETIVGLNKDIKGLTAQKEEYLAKLADYQENYYSLPKARIKEIINKIREFFSMKG